MKKRVLLSSVGRPYHECMAPQADIKLRRPRLLLMFLVVLLSTLASCKDTTQEKEKVAAPETASRQANLDDAFIQQKERMATFEIEPIVEAPSICTVSDHSRCATRSGGRSCRVR